MLFGQRCVTDIDEASIFSLMMQAITIEMIPAIMLTLTLAAIYI